MLLIPSAAADNKQLGVCLPLTSYLMPVGPFGRNSEKVVEHISLWLNWLRAAVLDRGWSQLVPLTLPVGGFPAMGSTDVCYSDNSQRQ